MKKIIIMLFATSLMFLTAFADETLSPTGVYMTSNGTIMFTDSYSKSVWEIDEDGELFRIAGVESDLEGVPAAGGYTDGDAHDAAFLNPWGIAPYDGGYVIADSENHVLRFLKDGEVTTIAGSGDEGLSSGIGEEVEFSRPSAVVADDDGNIYIADTGNNVIRVMDEDREVTTYAGSTEGNSDGSLSTAKFNELCGLSYYDDVLYVADSGNNRICKIENGQVTTIAGSKVGEEGDVSSDALSSRFSYPLALHYYDGALYISDTNNSSVKKLEDGVVTTIAEMGEFGNYPITPMGITAKDDTLYVADAFVGIVFSVELDETQIIPSGFSDVPQNAWYKTALDFLSAQGIMKGTEQTVFSPAEYVTRGMFVELLARSETYTDSDAVIGGSLTFSDVSETAYYYDAVSWALDRYLVTGYDDGTFRPENTLTRAEAVTMLHRYLVGGQEIPHDAIMTYDDFEEIPEYAKDAFAYCVNMGIISGKSQETLAPNDLITRAEVAQILYKTISIN